MRDSLGNSTATRTLEIAIAGNPNAGKTTLLMP